MRSSQRLAALRGMPWRISGGTEQVTTDQVEATEPAPAKKKVSPLRRAIGLVALLVIIAGVFWVFRTVQCAKGCERQTLACGSSEACAQAHFRCLDNCGVPGL